MDNWTRLYDTLAQLAEAQNAICADQFTDGGIKRDARQMRNAYQNVRIYMRTADPSLTREPADDLSG